MVTTLIASYEMKKSPITFQDKLFFRYVLKGNDDIMMLLVLKPNDKKDKNISFIIFKQKFGYFEISSSTQIKDNRLKKD
ncbi:hypothetical protein BpHYR1_031065 [Brachionus plicatilis]|uniref:Uncharacterized protein n=1 Tax=Brachionus plicatilis TaxID=10195 RepID=A0A3M7RXJ6_BRAPC|nr:hypothetical protein BpHYR1_031065 [Brachionus plicatilis]